MPPKTRPNGHARHEKDLVPKEDGVYMIEGETKLTPIKAAESKVVNDKRRSVLKVMSPLPVLSGKATLELDGPHAVVGTDNREPQFYIRLSEEERFGIIRMGEHKGNRVVEKLTIVPVSKETIEEPNLVETFRQQMARWTFQTLAGEAHGTGRIRGGRIYRGQGQHAGVGLFRRARRREISQASPAVEKIPGSAARTRPNDSAAPWPCRRSEAAAAMEAS